jgi:hypothetical protein
VKSERAEDRIVSKGLFNSHLAHPGMRPVQSALPAAPGIMLAVTTGPPLKMFVGQCTNNRLSPANLRKTAPLELD